MKKLARMHTALSAIRKTIGESDHAVNAQSKTGTLKQQGNHAMTETLFKYGPAENVSLSMAELAKLKERFGDKSAGAWIERLSLWKAAKGKKTKSDYYTILMWARKDEERVEALADDPQDVGGNGNGNRRPREYETKSEQLIRKQKESGERVRELLRRSTRDGAGSSD